MGPVYYIEAAAMTLTVRLKPELESALELHCAERGVTKSLMVQEVLAEYLARPSARRPHGSAPAMPVEPSANYRAFEALGLIGAGDLGGRSADKARVREVIAQRMADRSTRRKR
jgi:hypothetical protein